MAGRVCRTLWQMHVSTSDLGADLCPATETARGRHLASRRPIRGCGPRIPGRMVRQSGSNPRERDVAFGYMYQSRPEGATIKRASGQLLSDDLNQRAFLAPAVKQIGRASCRERV